MFLIITVSLTSCQIGHEVHYFKSGKNYYRIKINESSFASKARYMSGFYDEKALDKYFSEMSQPKESDSTKASAVSFLNPSSDGTDQLRIDSNKKFVMILSSNSNAVSEQIGAFAENEQILESIARLSNKDKVEQSLKFAADIDKSKKRNVSVIGLGDQFITNLPDSASATTVKNNFASFLQFLKDQSVSNTTGVELLLRRFQK